MRLILVGPDRDTGVRHEWEVTFHDGPTGVTDWTCKKCGDLRQVRSPTPPGSLGCRGHR